MARDAVRAVDPATEQARVHGSCAGRYSPSCARFTPAKRFAGGRAGRSSWIAVWARMAESTVAVSPARPHRGWDSVRLHLRPRNISAFVQRSVMAVPSTGQKSASGLNGLRKLSVNLSFPPASVDGKGIPCIRAVFREGRTRSRFVNRNVFCV